MDLFQKCVVLFILSLAVDLVQTVHIQACAARDLAQSVSTVVVVHLICFWGQKWFVEHKSSWARWMLTVACALGAGCATGVVITFGG